VGDLNRVYRREPALHQVDFEHTGFEWIDCHNWEQSVLSYLRKARNPADSVSVCCNFTPIPRHNYRLGVSELGWYQEIFNSDSKYYGGSNVGNGPGAMAECIPWHDRPYSINLTLPPLGALMLKPHR
jgi:1,4-alpha-glucan branching enzyme